MTSRVLSYGNGAAGVLAYLTHDRAAPDEPHPETDKRVAGIAIRGMPLEDGASPEERSRAIYLAGRIIQNNITDAEHLKQRAGVSNRGRKRKYGLVHCCPSWGEDERPTWEQMVAAGDSWLKSTGLEGHLTVMVAHVEEGLPRHLHLVSCLIDPENGRAYRGNLALGGSGWAEQYERAHGGIRIKTRVERNRIRAETRELRREAREAQERAGLGDKVLSIVGASTAQRLERQIQKRQAEMPATEETRSAGLHRQRADEGTKPTWAGVYAAQRAERQALVQKGATQAQIDQLDLEHKLARTELGESLQRGEDVENPRTQVPAPIRYRAAATDPGEGERATAWFREHAPESKHGRALEATGFTPSRLVETLGPELGARWADALRQHIARQAEPGRLRPLLKPGGDPAKRALTRVWFEVHEPTKAVVDKLLADRQTPRMIASALGPEAGPPWAEAMRQSIAQRPRPTDLSSLFDPEGDPIDRELKLEWFRSREPEGPAADALLTAGTPQQLEKALGPELAERWVQAAKRHRADGPPPDTAELLAALTDPAKREIAMDWFRSNEPTEVKLRAVVATETDILLLATVLTGPPAALGRADGRELAQKWLPGVDRQYVIEIGAYGLYRKMQAWHRQFDEWEKLVYPPTPERKNPGLPSGPNQVVKLPPPAEAERRALEEATRAQAEVQRWVLEEAARALAEAQRRAAVLIPAATPPAPRTPESPPPTTRPGAEQSPGTAMPAAAPPPAPARQPEQAQAMRAPEPAPPLPAAPRPPRPAGATPTNEDLIEDLRTGDPAGQQWFWTHRPDRDNVRKVVREAVDPELVARVLPPELAADWVARLEETYAVLKKQQGPVSDEYRRQWKQKRPEWERLPTPPAPTQPDGQLAELPSELQRKLLREEQKRRELDRREAQVRATSAGEQRLKTRFGAKRSLTLDEKLSVVETVEMEICQELDAREVAIKAEAGGGELLQRVEGRRGAPRDLAAREKKMFEVEQVSRATDEVEIQLPTTPNPERRGCRVSVVFDAMLNAVPAEDDDPFVGDVVFLLKARYAQRTLEGVSEGGYDAAAREESARRHFGSAVVDAMKWCVQMVREILLAACHKILGGGGESGERVQASLEGARAERQAQQSAVESAAQNVAIDVNAFSQSALGDGRDPVSALEEATAPRRKVLEEAQAAGVDFQKVFAEAEEKQKDSGFAAIEAVTNEFVSNLERREWSAWRFPGGKERLLAEEQKILRGASRPLTPPELDTAVSAVEAWVEGEMRDHVRRVVAEMRAEFEFVPPAGVVRAAGRALREQYDPEHRPGRLVSALKQLPDETGAPPSDEVLHAALNGQRRAKHAARKKENLEHYQQALKRGKQDHTWRWSDGWSAGYPRPKKPKKEPDPAPPSREQIERFQKELIAGVAAFVRQWVKQEFETWELGGGGGSTPPGTPPRRPAMTPSVSLQGQHQDRKSGQSR